MTHMQFKVLIGNAADIDNSKTGLYIMSGWPSG